MRTIKFEFINELRKKLGKINLCIDDILAVDIFILKDYDDKIKETITYQLPVVHTNEELLEFINKVNTESTVFKTNEHDVVNFFISGTIWFKDNSWVTIELNKEHNEDFFYFDYGRPLLIKHELYNLKSINCKKKVFKPNNLKSFNELISDEDGDLYWVTKRSIYEDNLIRGFLDNIVMDYNTFDSIKNIIDCACFKITTVHEKVKEDHKLVLKKNYTEKDLVNFLLSLNVYGTIISSVSYVWLKSGRECWSYEKIKTEELSYFDWKCMTLPRIDKRCLYEEK